VKRTLVLIFLTVACIVGFLSVRGILPFMPVFGSSMEPTLQSGGLLMIEPIDARDVKMGDIIVYNVPSLSRDYSNYPPVVAHRVTEITTAPSLSFRTRGDNTGEDPFTIRPQDLRGTAGDQIPYLGLPLQLFQSQHSMIFVIAALVLLTLCLYARELSHGGNRLHRGIFAPVINEEKLANRVLTHKIEATEQKIISTEQALGKFAVAIEVYARHLSSHTSAIQGLREASHELKRGAAEQNRVLTYLMESMIQPGPRQETITPGTELVIPVPEKPTPDPEKLAFMRMQATHERQRIMLKKEKPAPEAEKSLFTAPEDEKTQFPPGCARSRHLLPTR
jgi:signal peptidase